MGSLTFCKYICENGHKALKDIKKRAKRWQKIEKESPREDETDWRLFIHRTA
jgi:hypothetical protein